jgi:hypothetical protein
LRDFWNALGGANDVDYASPEKLIFGVGPEDKVYVQLQYSPDQTGLPPDVELAIALTPNEARAFADVLYYLEKRMRRRPPHGDVEVKGRGSAATVSGSQSSRFH